MAGYTNTQTRPVLLYPYSELRNGVRISGGDVPTSVLGANYPRQTTTSFRTGRRASEEGSLEKGLENEILETGTSVGVFQSIKDQQDFGPANPLDSGHPFETETQWVELPNGQHTAVVGTGATATRYSSYCVVNPATHPVANSNYVSIPTWDASYYGGKAIALTAPTHPSVGLLTALTELYREGIPSLTGLRFLKKEIQGIRGLGDEYLNYQFGWKPLVSDVKKAYQTLIRSDELLAQYARDNGRIVRRKMSFPPIVTWTSSTPKTGNVFYKTNSTQPAVWAGSSTNTSPNGVLTETTSVEQRISFSGAYTYHTPVPQAFTSGLRATVEKIKSYERLYGTELTPEVVWNITPWSWLVDWYTNFGSLTSQLSNFRTDGLVLRYGYLMRYTHTQRIVTVSGPALKDGTAGPWHTVYHKVRKERIRAHPYGFSGNPSAFTDRQWNILAALGATRAPKTLWP